MWLWNMVYYIKGGRMFKNRIQEGVFGPKRDESREWRRISQWETSYRINLSFYLFSHIRPIQQLCFFAVGLSSLIWHFQQVLWVLKFLLSPGSSNWNLPIRAWNMIFNSIEKLHSLYWSPNTVRMIKSRRLGCACQVATIEEGSAFKM